MKKYYGYGKNKFDDSEYYRELRTNIEFSSFKKKIQVLNITSSQQDEGKTTVSCNLAKIYAAKSENVLIMDCDLRKPSVHRHFRISNKKGLSNLLLNDNLNVYDSNFFQYFVTEDNQQLYILTAGSKVPNPQELLSSEKFIQLVGKLRERFSFIIIDCPPLLPVSDAIPISNVSDGTILVVSAMNTDKNDAKLTLSTLKRNGANVIGAVLNKEEIRNDKHYQY